MKKNIFIVIISILFLDKRICIHVTGFETFNVWYRSTVDKSHVECECVLNHCSRKDADEAIDYLRETKEVFTIIPCSKEPDKGVCYCYYEERYTSKEHKKRKKIDLRIPFPWVFKTSLDSERLFKCDCMRGLCDNKDAQNGFQQLTTSNKLAVLVPCAKNRKGACICATRERGIATAYFQLQESRCKKMKNGENKHTYPG